MQNPAPELVLSQCGNGMQVNTLRMDAWALPPFSFMGLECFDYSGSEYLRYGKIRFGFISLLQVWQYTTRSFSGILEGLGGFKL